MATGSPATTMVTGEKAAGAETPAQFREETPRETGCDLSAEAAPVAGDLMSGMVASVADREVLTQRAKGDDQERGKQEDPDHAASPELSSDLIPLGIATPSRSAADRISWYRQ